MSKHFSSRQIANYLLTRWGKKGELCKAGPVAICLFVTDRCTLSCAWCLRQTRTAVEATQRPDMTLEAARQILAYFPGASHLSLAGFGEPLLAQDLFRIIAEARKRPMRVSIITNGTLLRDRMDELLRAKAHSVSISMNSLDAADYQRVCGGSENTFQRLLEGIEMLIGKRTVSRPLVRISFVLSRNLLDRTEEMIRLAEKMKVDSLDFHNMIQHDLSKGFQGMLTADDEEVLRRFSEWSRRSYKVKIGWPKLIKKSLSRPENICYPSWDWLGVDMEGNVAGCSKVMTAKKKYGNLFSEGNKVWNNEFRKELRAEFLKREFLYDCCKTCTEVQL